MFKKKTPKIAQINSLADVKSRIREFFMDTQSSDADEMALQMGCVPLSDELMEKEEEESDKRIERVAYLLPLLFSFAHLYSQGMVMETTSNVKDPEMTPEVKAALIELEKQVRQVLEDNISNVLVGAVSQLVDLELLNVPKGRR